MNRFLRPTAFSVSVLIFLGFSLGAGLTDTLAEDAGSLICYYVAMALSGIAVWAFFPDNINLRKASLLILSIAVVARILMAGFPASDDVNRYLWEGKLLLEGVSPYSRTADDPAWQAHRDTFWEAMNHKDKKTAYPPLSLVLFAGLNLISYNLWLYKLFFGLTDLAALALLMKFLVYRNLPVRNSIIYALSPLTVVAFSGEGHFDSLFIFLTLSALYLYDKNRISSAWILIGLSIQIKIVSVLIIPLLFWKYRSAKVLWVLAPLALPCLLFINDIPNLINGILHFGSSMSHNGSINHLFIDMLGSRESASGLSLALLAITVVVVSIRSTDAIKGVFTIFGALILLSPTVHYWYLSWVLPFAVLFPSLPWLLLFALSGFYFSAWVQFGRTGEWYQPIGYLRLQWIPFYILWFPQFVRGLRKLISRQTNQLVESISVVIPTLNEATHLRSCLKSLDQSSVPIDKIIVVDGGSQDETKSMIEAFTVQLLESKKGRGYQISLGVNACHSDAILVLHADASLPPEGAEKIISVLNKNPDVVGGAIGQRFVSTTVNPILLLVEALNDFRATWQSSSFGDQGQFFRRVTIERAGGFPSIPLMEDVELTTQLNKKGNLVLLDGRLHCSARRWEKDNAAERFLQVLSLVVRYKFLKFIGIDPSKKLFEEYDRS